MEKATNNLLKQLKSQCDKQEIGVRELGRRTASDASHVSKILRGNHAPNLDFMVQLCHAAGLEICLTTKKK